jgi:flagellin
MSLDVNFNSAASVAHNNLQATNLALQNSIATLSSGLRINTAADDPAGLVTSNQMGAQADGMMQAIANANDGINLVKTAEGALNETSSLLDQMRTLAVHAANAGVNSAGSAAADQAAFTAASASIDRISTSTQFNGTNLLDGTFSAAQFQIGANAADTTTVTIAKQDSTTLGVNVGAGGLDLTTAAGATAAITAIDAAISAVSTSRASLGSLQTYTLQTTINSLTVGQQDIAAAQSSIKDADMASSMTTYTRNNIMEQAGVSMLAQANQSPQAILKLLQ